MAEQGGIRILTTDSLNQTAALPSSHALNKHLNLHGTICWAQISECLRQARLDLPLLVLTICVSHGGGAEERPINFVPFCISPYPLLTPGRQGSIREGWCLSRFLQDGQSISGGGNSRWKSQEVWKCWNWSSFPFLSLHSHLPHSTSHCGPGCTGMASPDSPTPVYTEQHWWPVYPRFPDLPPASSRHPALPSLAGPEITHSFHRCQLNQGILFTAVNKTALVPSSGNLQSWGGGDPPVTWGKQSCYAHSNSPQASLLDRHFTLIWFIGLDLLSPFGKCSHPFMCLVTNLPIHLNTVHFPPNWQIRTFW